MSSNYIDIADLKLCTEGLLARNYDKVARFFGLYQCCCCNRYPFTLCDTCWSKIIFSLPECSICRAFSETGEIHHICQRKALVYTRVLSLYSYTKPIKALFALYKYDSAFQYQRVIEKLLKEYFRLDPFLQSKKWRKEFQDKRVVFLPVPMTKRKQGERGFSPAVQLAILFGRRFQQQFNCHIRVCFGLVRKVKDSQAQAKKNRRQRLLSLSNSYELCQDQVNNFMQEAPEILCIVDDVLTTGATTTTMLDQLATNDQLKAYLKTIPVIRLAFASA